MKVINSAVLSAITIGFSTAFQAGLGQAPSQWNVLATRFPSATRQNDYGWLGDIPGMKKWLGPRQVNALKAYKYSLENEPYEDTIGVDRDDIEDDMEGLYAPRFTAMGRAVGAFPDQLVFAAAKDGFTTNCYDGQFFFDTDHPVINEAGDVVSVANTDGGSGEPWFLIDSKQPIKPFILQERKAAQFVSMVNPNDHNVFMNKEFLYGADGRWAAGYGFWQWCWGSKQTLDATRYKTAREKLISMKGDHGRPMGVMPDLLVTGPANEEAARKLLNSELMSGGETNPWRGTATLVVVPWLA
jgi:phage major head subunit gpT-like protein